MTNPTPPAEVTYHFHRQAEPPHAVSVRRNEQPLPPRPDIWSAIAETFDAGHCGPRAHALAIAILSDAADDLSAVEHSEAFVAGFLSIRKNDAWNCRKSDILDWIEDRMLQLENDLP